MDLSRRGLIIGACASLAWATAGPARAVSFAGPGVDPLAFARERFLSHFNCTQAVLEALAPQGLDPDMTARLTTAFAAGMWNGLTCDAESRAVAKTSAKLRQLNQELTAKFGDLNCSALLGVDMATDQGVAQAQAQGLFTSKCPELVVASVRAGLALMA